MKRFLLMVAIIMAVVTFVTNLGFNGFEDVNVNKNTSTVYIDGEKIECKQNNDSFEITSGESTLCVNDDSTGSASISTADGVEKYSFKINELTKDSINVEVTNLTSGEEYVITEYDRLMDSEYEGQMAITAGAISTAAICAALETMLWYLVIIGATIIVAGVTYYALDAVVKKIESDKNKYAYKYYPAYLSGKGVFVAFKNPISAGTASSYIKSKKNIYTYYASNAKGAVLGTGLGSTNAEIDSNRKKGYVYYWHYHTAGRNGAHAWYGKPIYG